MRKVRWTTRCAGGCGQWLTVGTYATRLHGNLWCDACLSRHREKCLILTG